METKESFKSGPITYNGRKYIIWYDGRVDVYIERNQRKYGFDVNVKRMVMKSIPTHGKTAISVRRASLG